VGDQATNALVAIVLGTVLAVLYAVLTVVAAWRTKDHRGLSHALAHLDLRIGDEADEGSDLRRVGA
jgi:hypothetical protein